MALSLRSVSALPLGLLALPATGQEPAGLRGRPLPGVVPARAVSEVVVANDCLVDGRVDLGALGLGEGGTGEPVVARSALRDGQFLTPGGVLVRVQREGLKLDFPSGAEVLVDPGGRAHLRDGSQTLPAFHGLALWLTDGTELVVRTASGGRAPFDLVEVRRRDADGDLERLDLWRRGRAVVEATSARSQALPRAVLALLGDGRVAYSVDRTGPVLFLERQLCPRTLEDRTPERRIVVLGEVLAASMRELPARVPRPSVQFPEAYDAVRNLAEISERLFALPLVGRGAGVAGIVRVPLGGEFLLGIEAPEKGPILLGLLRRESTIPLIEWRVGLRSTLHMVRPDGGERGPRYFQEGLQLELLDGLYPVEADHRVRERIRGRLRAMGAIPLETLGKRRP